MLCRGLTLWSYGLFRRMLEKHLPATASGVRHVDSAGSILLQGLVFLVLRGSDEQAHEPVTLEVVVGLGFVLPHSSKQGVHLLTSAQVLLMLLIDRFLELLDFI